MEPSKEAIAVRIARLNRQILGKVTAGTSTFSKRTIEREALLDALTVLYDECNDDPIKKSDELVRSFVDKYRSTVAELRRIRVCISDFEIIQTIGRGQFGDVHMVREKETCDVYALKCVRKELARRRAGSAEDEREVLASSTGPWTPKLQYAFQDNTNLYLVMELCSGGDLAGLLGRRHHPLSERAAAFYVASAAHALKALHQLGFVHRDVKPHNILLDRCGHVKLADFGSVARLSSGEAAPTPATADYVAPELLAAAACAARHAVCLECCRGVVHTAVSACDYWSLGVIAFELVTLRRPFSSDEGDSVAQVLSNIQKYERSEHAEPPFEPPPNGPSDDWRSLVSGLLRVQPSRRFNYLDTLQHASLAHLSVHSIRDQPPPWVPLTRGPEDASHFAPPPRAPPPPDAAPFRARPPFAGQLPFIGYSYVAPDDKDDSGNSIGFSTTSHDSTAIDLATFKSAEKLAATRAREIASLQSKLAAAESAASAAAERARRAADDEAERTRARLQAEITALSLQNKRLERQIEIEKEERMALERTNQELMSAASERNSSELRVAQQQATELACERDSLRDGVARLEARVSEMKAECARAVADADSARAQHKHYKDTIAKERALRRQTLSGGEAETREAGARAAAAEATAARETRAREQLEKRLAEAEAESRGLRAELEEARRELTAVQESLSEKKRVAAASTDQLKEAQLQLTHERMRASTLQAQVQELQRGLEEAARREAALEEQCSRTEARFNERLDAADARAAAALHDDARHREKVSTLEQLVRQLEREVTALEGRACAGACAGTPQSSPGKGSDTESLADAAPHVAALRDQLQRADTQLQARADEIAALRQEARTANLARWRKEREFNDLSVEAKATARDLKRAEERLSIVTEARRAADKKATELKNELDALKPQYEEATKEAARVKEQLVKLQKQHETAQAEVDRSRNDIRKLKSELQYSEKRRMHAEEQEEQSSRERGQLRDELTELRAHANELAQNNKALQEACSLLEEQLIDLEKLSDIHEVKNKDLESEVQRMRAELSCVAERLANAERAAAEQSAAAALAQHHHGAARDQARHSGAQLQRLRERLENREARVAELESVVASLEGSRSAAEAALGAAARRVRDLQEECAALRTRAHDHHAAALQLQAQLGEAQVRGAAARRVRDLQEECAALRTRAHDHHAAALQLQAQLGEAQVRGAAARRVRDLQEECAALRTRAHDHHAAALQLQAQLGEAQVRGAAARRVRDLQEECAALRTRAHDHHAAALQLQAQLGEAQVRGAAARRVRDLQEECAALRTRAHDHHAAALQLQAQLGEAQEEVASAREAADAATAWWRTRETKADATLRQQAKLIDFLQAKVEEAGRKKCSLSNKLFGRSGRRPAASPPLRRANRELREEVDRLRAKLAASNAANGDNFPPTPRREKPKPAVNGVKSIDTPDGAQDSYLQIVWRDGSRERMRARTADGALLLGAGEQLLRARLVAPAAPGLPHNEASRAFAISIESCPRGREAAAVCSDMCSRAAWLARLAPPPAVRPAGYAPDVLKQCTVMPVTALYYGSNTVAVGCSDGLHSLRGPIRLEPVAAPRVAAAAACGPRALVAAGGALWHGSSAALESALKRAPNLKPSFTVAKVKLTDSTAPHLLRGMAGDNEGTCAAACGRRVSLLRLDPASGEYRVARALTLDRAPASLLLTPTALYVAGDRPLRVTLPSGALETFAADDLTVAAAAKKKSPPKAILLVKPDPLEILLCYAECGVFVDGNGKRTRNDDPKWSSAVTEFEYVNPFLYAVGEDLVTIVHINDEAYKAPPCTCDTHSLASSASESYLPEVFTLKLSEPALLGTTSNGVILRTKNEDGGYEVVAVEGMAAFKSIGASLESLDTVSDTKGSTTDLMQPDLQHDVSQDSVEATTGFLADIRKRARQLREKNRKEEDQIRMQMQALTPDDVIKEILTTEVGLKRVAGSRQSPPVTSEFDSDSDSVSEGETDTDDKCAAALCAEMFTRQVRFE